MDASQRLRELLNADGVLVLPGAHDALSALLIERAGFDAVFTSGFGLAASLLGVPDVGLMSGSQAIERATTIAGLVNVPILADMDTGYGNALNAVHTARACARAGIAGIILEDQEWPKRCGHMDGKTVVPAERHAAHLRAAREAAPDLVIVARSDARAPLGLEAAIEYGHRYVESGIDALFIEALTGEEEMERVCREFSIPLVANMVEGGKTPYRSPAELAAIGYRAALYPVSGLLAAASAMERTFARLRHTGRADSEDLMTFPSIQEVVGVPTWRSLDAVYAEG